MGNEVKDYKSKPPSIKGVTTINHALRVEMGLGPMEYILMDAVIWLKNHKKPVTDVNVYIQAGLVPQEQTLALEMLVKKGYIYPTAEADGSPDISDKWYSFFTSVEDEFSEFWIKDGKNCWPGSKPKALELYLSARKKTSKEDLLKSRDSYFKFLKLVHKNGFNRPKMMATVFLGKQERYMEDWEEYAKQEEDKFKREEDIPVAVNPSTNTTEERLKKYENPNIEG